jgi:hypothetical protein
MAIVVIGGLITSTFLSLLVIPVVFTFVDDLVQWSARIFGRKGHHAAALPSATQHGPADRHRRRTVCAQ